MQAAGTVVRRLWRDRIRSWYRATLEEDAYLALRIALAYLSFGVVWITVSDRLVAAVVSDPAVLSRVQTFKGWAFVLATTLFIHAVTWYTIRARRNLRVRSRESERFLNTLIENLPGAVYACADDAEWTMSYLSSGVEALTGHAPDELTGSSPPSYGSLIHEADRDYVRKTVSAAVEADRSFQLEYRIRARSGELRWVWEQGRAVYSDDGDLRQLEGFITDVTERRHADDRVQEQIDRLRALRAIDRAIMGSLDRQITLDVVLDQVTTQLGVDAAAVLTFNARAAQLERAAGRGFRTTTSRHTRVRLGEGPAGRAALRRELVRLSDLAEATGPDVSWLAPEEEFVAYFAAPLVAQGHLLGVLELFHRSRLDPKESWLEFLDMLAGQTAIALDNANLFEGLEQANAELRVAYDQTIEGWARALDLRDHETEGHSRRVMELAVALAERLGVEDEDLVHIRHGALLHDIGKLGISDTILLKPGPLTDEERELMCRHPDYAVDLLSPISFLEPALDIPRCHHERWDGDGYPRGLAGEEIPLAARIFAVADVWDALRSDRPYRAAWSFERTRAHIRDLAGAHFDPRVVETFLSIEPAELAWIERHTDRASLGAAAMVSGTDAQHE